MKSNLNGNTRAVALALILIPAHLWAGIAYTNLGPGNTFSPITEQAQSGPSSSFFVATTFTTTGAGPLSVVMAPVSGTNSPVTMGLYTNSGGQPGALLESWIVPITNTTQLVTLTSVVAPVLNSGTQYWFVITLPSNTTFNWQATNQGLNGGMWFGNTINTFFLPFPTFPAVAIQLLTTTQAAPPVPAPATLLLTLTGLAIAGLTFLWKRNRNAGAMIG